MGKRERPENGKQMYYSDARAWTPITLHHVTASTEKEGTFYALIQAGGRERYLQIDSESDREVLATLDGPVDLEIKNFGSIQDPKLLIRRDGQRIDRWGTGANVGGGAPAGAAGGVIGAIAPTGEALLAALGAATGRAPVSIPQMARVYAESFQAARQLAETVDPKGQRGFDVSEAASAIGGWYVLSRLLGAPAERRAPKHPDAPTGPNAPGGRDGARAEGSGSR